MRRRKVEAAWTALLLVASLLGLATSEGEPACTGPLIWRVDDSLPPQCPSPVDALPVLGIAWVVGMVVIVTVKAMTQTTEGRPSRSAATDR